MSNTNNNQINFLSLLQWLIIAIKKNIKVLLIINFVIIVIGVSAKLYIPKSYEGSLIVKSNFIEFHFISGILNPLSQHSKDKKTGSIARSLNIPMELAETFGGYDVTSLIDEEYVAKRKNTWEANLSEYEKDQVFELRVRSSKIENLPKIKDAVLNFLRNQDYIKKRQAFYLQKKKDIKTLYEADIESMTMIKDGFAKKGFDPNKAGNDLIIQGLGDFFFGSMRIYDEYIITQYEFEFNDSFEELSNFEIYTRHVYPRWTPFIIGMFLVGVFLSFIYIIIVELNRSLKTLEDSKN